MVDAKGDKGERYFTIMREEGGGYMELFMTKFKSDIITEMDKLIGRRRRQPMFSNYDNYEFCSYLKLDPDGL